MNKDYAFRKKIVRDAQNWIKPKKIPISAHMYTWAFHYAGVPVSVATRDYNVVREVMQKVLTDFNVDVTTSGCRNPFILTDAFSKGQNAAYINEESLNAIVEGYFTLEDYDEIIAGNYDKALWNALFRKYEKAKDFTPEDFLPAIDAMKLVKAEVAKTYNYIENTLGVTIAIRPIDRCATFINDLFIYYRGIKSLSIDLRRNTQKLMDVCDAVDNPKNAALEKAILSSPYGYDENDWHTIDYCASWLAQNILNQKQFDFFIAKRMAPILRACEEKGKNMFMVAEGSYMRFSDFLNDYKKGVMSAWVEQDDVYEFRKNAPNFCIYGGLIRDILGHGTPHECVEMAKKAIDNLGAEGGLVLQANKMLSYPSDCKAENFKAVCEYVNNL